MPSPIIDNDDNRFAVGEREHARGLRIQKPTAPQLLDSLDQLGDWFCRYDPGGMDSAPLTAWNDASGNGRHLDKFGNADVFIPTVENTFLPGGQNYLDFTPSQGCYHEFSAGDITEITTHDTGTGMCVFWLDVNSGDDMIFGLSNQLSRWATLRIEDEVTWGFNLERPDNGASGEFCKHYTPTHISQHAWNRVWWRQDASGNAMDFWVNGAKLTDVAYTEVDGSNHLSKQTWLNEWTGNLRMEAITMGAKIETDATPSISFASDSKVCWAGFMEAALTDEAIEAGDRYQKNFLDFD